jgi:hypothetical protein
LETPVVLSSSFLYSQLRTRIFSCAISSVLLLLCYYWYCSHITVAFTSFLLLVLLQVQLNWQLNKFGFYFPRRLLWSPIFVGHQRVAIAFAWQRAERVPVASYACCRFSCSSCWRQSFRFYQRLCQWWWQRPVTASFSYSATCGGCSFVIFCARCFRASSCGWCSNQDAKRY